MKTTFKTITTALLALLLLACGSSPSDSVENQLSSGIAPVTKSAEFGKPASAEAVAATAKELGSYFNGKNANNPQALTGVPAASGNSATNSTNSSITAQPMVAASNVAKAVYRFYNTHTSTHFYTMSTSERDYVQATFPYFNFEGTSFFAYPATDPALSPVYRFFNKVTATHFFTINASEKDHVIATWPHIFNFEGISWYASTTSQTGWIPVYRFYNTQTGTHFYTTNPSERDYVQATWNWFNYEGIAYYVRPDATVECTAAPVGTTGYSLVFKGCNAVNVAEYYDKTECVRDNATGLIWQGQTPAGTGLRANDQIKTNYDSTTEPQRWNGSAYVAPTQAQVNATSNSIGFKNAVNAANLCGSTAWRLPTKDELLGIVKTSQSPMIDNAWFPNTQGQYYWSSSPRVGYANYAWLVSFASGSSPVSLRNAYYSVRLVRAS